MEIFTIGFTQTTAEDFFGRLKAHRIERLLDVRLNNRSQLAGFAKRDDLAYFLRELVGAKYEHAPLLAPSEEILSAYRWAGYPTSGRGPVRAWPVNGIARRGVVSGAG